MRWNPLAQSPTPPPLSVSNPEVCPPSSNTGWLPLHSSTIPSIWGKGQVQSPSLLLNWLFFAGRFPSPAMLAAAPLWFVPGMIFVKRSALWTLQAAQNPGCFSFSDSKSLIKKIIIINKSASLICRIEWSIYSDYLSFYKSAFWLQPL